MVEMKEPGLLPVSVDPDPCLFTHDGRLLTGVSTPSKCYQLYLSLSLSLSGGVSSQHYAVGDSEYVQ